MESKVLVAAPTFDGMKYCENEFIKNLKNLSYKNHDVLLVDNSRSLDYFNELKDIPGIKVIHDTTNETKSIYRLISSRNLIIEYAKKNNYSYILMLDSDIIPPKDIIEQLLIPNKDLISGLYFNYFNIGGIIKYLPVAWKYLTEEEFIELKKLYSEFKKFKDRKEIRRHLTKEEVDSKDIHEVAMLSAGCMLISRKVFEKVKYDLLEKDKKKPSSGDDTYFIEKAKELGFIPYCSTKIICTHIINGKYEKDALGNIIHKSFKDLLSN